MAEEDALVLMTLVCVVAGARPLSSRFEQDAALFAPVGGWGGKRARHGSQAPFFHVGFDEDEAGLAEVDVDGAGAVGAHGGEEVLVFKAVRDVVEFFAVACEEDGAGAGPIADAYYVALDVGRAVGGGGEGLVVPAGAGGGVGEGGAVPACEMLEGSFGGGRGGEGEMYLEGGRGGTVLWRRRC